MIEFFYRHGIRRLIAQTGGLNDRLNVLECTIVFHVDLPRFPTSGGGVSRLMKPWLPVGTN